MLQVPKLDDLDYDKIVNRARGRISQYTDEWTDLNHHDPGMTTTQAMAWLVDTLNYYTDATGEEHRLRYLKLLGIEPEAAPSSCVLAMRTDEKEIALPPGTRVAAEDVTFELPNGYVAAANRMETIYQDVDGTFTDLTTFVGNNGHVQIFTYDTGKQAAVYFGFIRAMKNNVELYVEVSKEHMRNPFPQGEAPLLAVLSWEYHDGKSWQPAVLTEDHTGGFLVSGFIHLQLQGQTKRLSVHPLLAPAHYLRARLLRNDYDVLPEIGGVEPNCVTAEQVRTVSRTLELVYDGNNRMAIDYLVRDTDLIMVSVERGDGFAVWYRFVEQEGTGCTVESGGNPWEREIVFHADRGLPQPGSKVLVTILDSACYDQLILGKTTGCAGQRLHVDLGDLLSLRLALFDVSEGGLPRFVIWESCDDISTAACGERVFSYDSRSGDAVFGDSIAGMQPGSGKLVMALEAVTSLLGNGNARRGQVNRFEDATGDGIQVENITEAIGGKSPQNSYELEAQIPLKLENIARAVTTDDYIRLVKETPGLIIDLATVISRGEYDHCYGTTSSPNTVYLAVKPYSPHLPRPELGDAYRRIIRNQLEQHRLLTTNIQVIPARYVGITVSGRIVLQENTDWAKQQVEILLLELIDFRKTRAFGGNVVYGTIYSRLEMLDGVKAVAELNFSYVGGSCEKNSQGDVVVYADALAWLREIIIEFS